MKNRREQEALLAAEPRTSLHRGQVSACWTGALTPGLPVRRAGLETPGPRCPPPGRTAQMRATWPPEAGTSAGVAEGRQNYSEGQVRREARVCSRHKTRFALLPPRLTG